MDGCRTHMRTAFPCPSCLHLAGKQELVAYSSNCDASDQQRWRVHARLQPLQHLHRQKRRIMGHDRSWHWQRTLLQHVWRFPLHARCQVPCHVQEYPDHHQRWAACPSNTVQQGDLLHHDAAERYRARLLRVDFVLVQIHQSDAGTEATFLG
jgi:hypothetical protein